jgi:hypothetical protein
MIPRHFATANMVYQGSRPDIGDLPCERLTPGQVRSVWTLTAAERIAIGEGADIELLILTEPIPPVSLSIYGEPKLIPGIPVNDLPRPFKEK